MSEKFSQEKFTKNLYTSFTAKSESTDPVELKLTEVKMIHPNSDAFSLLFVGPSTNFLHQHTYKFHHEVIGDFELFIVPVGERQEGFIYQAIFDPIPTDSNQ